jgi:hypothetical protein
MGVGLGLVFSMAVNNATLGVEPADAGVASATVSASQQVGGSLGTALLSTLAASAATSALAGSRPTPALVLHAAVHGYTTAFVWPAAIFAVGAVIAGALLRAGRSCVRGPARRSRQRVDEKGCISTLFVHACVPRCCGRPCGRRPALSRRRPAARRPGPRVAPGAPTSPPAGARAPPARRRSGRSAP